MMDEDLDGLELVDLRRSYPVPGPPVFENVWDEDLPNLTCREQEEEARRVYDALPFVISAVKDLDGIAGLLDWVSDGRDFDKWMRWRMMPPEKIAAERARWDRGFREKGFWPPDRLYAEALAERWRYPLVVDDNQIEWMVRKAERVLVLAGAGIYWHYRRLYRVVPPEYDGDRYEPVGANWLRMKLTQYMDWQRAGQEELELGDRRSCGVPRDVVGAIMERCGEWTFPEVPTLSIW